MHYSIDPRDKRYVKGYGLLSFAKNMGTHATKVAKNLGNKYNHKYKLLDSAKKSTTDAIKTAPKRAIQKLAAAAGDLIDNKIVDKISDSNISSKETNNEIPKERYISPEERQQIIDELRLI